MPEPSSRKKSDALSVDQLVAIARQDRLPPGRRAILARTLAVLDPALLGELIARRNEVPAPSGPDPFVNALRRIFWPENACRSGIGKQGRYISPASLACGNQRVP